MLYLIGIDCQELQSGFLVLLSDIIQVLWRERDVVVSIGVCVRGQVCFVPHSA